MQEARLNLREVVWEATNYCVNGCTYCGSRTVAGNPGATGAKKALEVALALREYSPSESLVISGGDPLSFPSEFHKDLVGLDWPCRLSIVVNPLSLRQDSFDVLACYGAVGLSINDKREIAAAKEWINLNRSVLESEIAAKALHRGVPTTVITNFNMGNIFLFDTIAAFVVKHGFDWQVQYTIFKGDDTRALYSNPEAVEHIAFKLAGLSARSDRRWVPIIGDNMNSNPCTAGTASIGVTADGTVLPCLSMLAWDTELCQTLKVMQPGGPANVLRMPLKALWEGGFQEQRFGSFKCCKDACANASVGMYVERAPKAERIEVPPLKLPDIEELIGPRPWTPVPLPFRYPIVTMYAVQTQPSTGDVDFRYVTNSRTFTNRDDFGL